MSSAELPITKDVSAAAGPYVAKNFFRQLLGFLVVDIVVMLCFDGALWQWAALTGAEAVLLIAGLWRSGVSVRKVLEPMSILTEVAESAKDSALDANDLRRLAQRLERVEAPTMDQHVAVSGSGKELTALAEAINAMLRRIDLSYQAQVDFTRNASHELRTPIATIRGYAEMLNRWSQHDPEIRQEAIDTIIQTAKEMEQLVNQFLAQARGEDSAKQAELEWVDLTALVTAVAKQTDMVDDTHQVFAEVDTGIVGMADPPRIKECLRILCDNALKYTPAGGSVTIGLKAEEGWARIWVADTGCGIAEEEQPRIFERLYRVDKSRTGSNGLGLGLSIAAWIAAIHHGSIDVQSKLGVGSRFTLSIPLEPDEGSAGGAQK